MHLGITGHQAASAALQRPCHHVEQWLRAALTRTSRSLRTAHTGYVYQPVLRAYAPKAQGSLPRCPTHCTYAARVPASGVPYVPGVPWHTTGYEYEYEPAQHIMPQLETEQPLRPSSAYW